IGYGNTEQGVVGGPRPPCSVNRFDVETGAMTTGDKWTRKPEEFLVISRWSPDGKRVAHAVREKNEKGEESARILVCDPDGGNAVKLQAIPSQFMGDISWLPSPRKAAPRPEEPPTDTDVNTRTQGRAVGVGGRTEKRTGHGSKGCWTRSCSPFQPITDCQSSCVN